MNICHKCIHLFRDWTRAGDLYCSLLYFSGGRCHVERLVSLPDELICDSFSPALFLQKKEDVKLLISVISLGTRNDLLEQTLASIRKFNDVMGDIIVTVDGTEDISELNCLKDCSYYPVKERVGICEALNRSLSELISEYDYIMFCDDDVKICSPISKYICFLIEHSMFGLVSGYHGCGQLIAEKDMIFVPEFGLGLLKPTTHGCHMVMRCEEVKEMMPFEGGGWIYPFIHFDEWVCRKSEKSIAKIGKGIISFPRNVAHLGAGRSTWQGKEEKTEKYMNERK